MKKQLESQEMEVMEARLMKTSELNGELDDDDDDAGQSSQVSLSSDDRADCDPTDEFNSKLKICGTWCICPFSFLHHCF